MKISVIIGTMLVAQVSAAFLDVFQGAMLSVQNSFGKLLTDVVTDVKDTVDCTILAVEHVLSLSEDATARYYKKCGGAKNTTQSDIQPKIISPILEISFTNDMNKEIPEIDARINETLSKYFNGYNPHDRLKEVECELAAETQRLAAVNDLVRLELDRLSKEIHVDFSKVERRGSNPSVDSILDELRVLEAVEQNIRNATEAEEIHRLIDAVLKKLHEIESSEALQNLKVDGVLEGLEKTTNGSYNDMRQRLEDCKAEEARHLDVIQNKMKEHEKLPQHLEYVHYNYAQGIQPNSSDTELTTFFIITKKPNTVRDDNYNKSVAANASNTTTENLLSTFEITTKSSILPIISNAKSIKLAVEQFSNIPNIESQQSTTNSIQINDASKTITPVPTSTRFYVNEPNYAVTERFNLQTIEKVQAFDRVSTNTLDIITPLTGKETEPPSVTSLKPKKSSPMTLSDTAKITPVMPPEPPPTTTSSAKIISQVTSPPVMTAESTARPPVTSELSTKPLLMTLQPTVNSVTMSIPERIMSTSVITLKPNMTPVPTTNQKLHKSPSVMTPEPVTASPKMTPELISTPLITTEPTITPPKSIITPLVTTPEPATTPPETTAKPNTGPPETPAEIQTTRISTKPSLPTTESTTSTTEIMSKSTAASYMPTIVHSQLKVPTHELPIPTPSLAAFLDFVDRKGGRKKPAKRTTKMPANSVTRKPFHEPLPYARGNHSPSKSDLNTFLSHMPPSHPPNKSDLSTFLSHMPPSHPLPKSALSAFLSHMPSIKPSISSHSPPQKPHSLTPKPNNQNDFNSFFHHPSNRALMEARKLIADSQRAKRLLNNLKKKKGLNAFNLPRSLNIGK